MTDPTDWPFVIGLVVMLIIFYGFLIASGVILGYLLWRLH